MTQRAGEFQSRGNGEYRVTGARRSAKTGRYVVRSAGNGQYPSRSKDGASLTFAPRQPRPSRSQREE